MRPAAVLPRPTVGAVADHRLLEVAATFFALAVLIHNTDHLRRGGDSVTADVFWLGTAAIAIEVGVVVLVFLRHPSAPLAAVAAGFPLALGYLFVHFTPERTWLSDSFPGGDVSALSWFAASLETVAALVLGVAGVVVLRRRGVAVASGTGSTPLAAGVRHPVVVVMALGNLAILAGALLTR